MPTEPLRVCAAPGCAVRVASGYCSQHQRQRKVEHSRFYTGGGFYGRRWRKERAAFLAQHPWCACGCGQLATVVDHIIPHRGDPESFWAHGNWQPMTKTCHDRKTAGETWRVQSVE